jgi:hypothetical protein
MAVEGNGFQGSMSADAAGITACLFAFNGSANRTHESRLIDADYGLRDYALRHHPEAAIIAAAID